MMQIAFDGSLADWRRAAREALVQGYDPAEVGWDNAGSTQGDLELGGRSPPLAADSAAFAREGLRVPRGFLALAEEVACHRDESRWARLYCALWRLTHGTPHLLEIATDEDVHRLHAMAKAVRRDMHEMRAFVRFRAIPTDTGPWYVAWFEPQHLVVEANGPFFRDRFTGMRWSILTPDRCAHWDGAELTFTPGVARSSAPAEDAMEDMWRTYYASTFNPARINVSGMAGHMPRHYWPNLPEAKIIPGLVAAARPRTAHMVAASAAGQVGREDFHRPSVPDTTDLGLLRAAGATCQACPLWRNATCTVFGAGPPDARIVLVGEQPGDQEDRAGTPFVGPAGQLLNRALAAAGIDRSQLYLTNAVKHFKWEPRGKRRLHQRPNAREIAACRPWLEAELHALKPDVVVCLGATAAQSVTGRTVRVLSERGSRVETEFGAPALITVHPSALLRLPEGADPDAEFSRFVADLRRVHP